MKAIILNEPGGADKLIYTDIEKPAISGNEVLMQVKAISVNPVDVKVRAGHGVTNFLKMISRSFWVGTLVASLSRPVAGQTLT